QDQSDPEPPSAQPDVEPCRNQHREQELELEEDDAELRKKRGDRPNRRQQPPQRRTPIPAAARPDRLVAPPLIGILLHAAIVPARTLARCGAAASSEVSSVPVSCPRVAAREGRTRTADCP